MISKGRVSFVLFLFSLSLITVLLQEYLRAKEGDANQPWNKPDWPGHKVLTDFILSLLLTFLFRRYEFKSKLVFENQCCFVRHLFKLPKNAS